MSILIEGVGYQMSMRLYCTGRKDGGEHENYTNDPWMKCLDNSDHIIEESELQLKNQHDHFYADISNKKTPDLIQLTHVDATGQARMVDVSKKEPTIRKATARAVVSIGPIAFRLVADNQIKKGDVLKVAEIAGICASKLTWQLIPLCHPIAISNVQLNMTLDKDNYSVLIESHVTTVGPTGVEMEALTAVSVAALTVYDMIKAVTKEAEIRNIQLISKSGGASANYNR